MTSATMPAPTLAGIDIDNLSTQHLEEGIRGFAARLAAATCVFVLAVAEYDRRRGWESWECRSMAHWLTWKCAMGPVAAREHVRVGAALADLDLVRERFSAGALSYSQVRAITRVATVETETDLVDLAGAMTASQLDTVVRAYRRGRLNVTDPDRAPHARRGLTYHTDDDGSLVGTFRLAPEDGPVVVAALQAAQQSARGDAGDKPGHDDSGGDDAVGDPTLDPPAANQADALVALAGSYLHHKSDGDDEAVDDRYVVNIIVERRVLEGPGAARPDGVCQVEDGAGLDPETVRRLACEAPTVTIVEDQLGRTLDVGRRTRRVNRSLRRALNRRDGGCQFPGCTTRRTQAHHVVHWIDRGPTNLSNLVSLCSRHHHRHHEGAFRIAPGGTGGWVFTHADGRLIPQTVSPLCAGIDADPGVEPSVSACTPAWEGGGLSDLSGIVDGLLRREGVLVEPPPPAPWPDMVPPPPEAIAGCAAELAGDLQPVDNWPDPWPDPWKPSAGWPGA